MRISELARRGGVPLATVKFYLREGLLPAGTAKSATQAQYGEEHVARLGLVRALLSTGGLSIATARAVLAAVDDPAITVHEALGAAHTAIAADGDEDPPDLTEAREHLRRWGWRVHEDSPALAHLARALLALQSAGVDASTELLDRYAHAAGALGTQDVAEVPTTSTAGAVRFVVIGTLLLEPVLLALRRLAQEDASQTRFAPPQN